MRNHLVSMIAIGLIFVGSSFCAIAASKGKAVAFPPLPEGYYAFGATCAKVIAAASADDPPENLVRFHPKGFQEAGGGPSISRFEDLGGGTYRVFARSYGNGEDDVGVPDNFNITLIGKDAFRIENNMTQQYTHCPLNMVPKAIRESWFEF